MSNAGLCYGQANNLLINDLKLIKGTYWYMWLLPALNEKNKSHWQDIYSIIFINNLTYLHNNNNVMYTIPIFTHKMHKTNPCCWVKWTPCGSCYRTFGGTRCSIGRSKPNLYSSVHFSCKSHMRSEILKVPLNSC